MHAFLVLFRLIDLQQVWYILTVLPQLLYSTVLFSIIITLAHSAQFVD
jgi:hypothetical protein